MENSSCKKQHVRVPVGAGWVLSMAACPVQQETLFCLCLVQSLEKGAGSVPHKKDGAGGGCICLMLPRLQQCHRAHPSPCDLPEFTVLAPQNQAVSGSTHCVSIFAWPFGIKFKENLKEKTAVRVG